MQSLPAQFVLWKLVQRPGEPKPAKVPVNARGWEIDPHDSANWMTLDAAYAAASQYGFGLGFVFTEHDPYFFYDVDDCMTPDGQWTPEAIQICQMFTGAAIEISQSGTGLHIIGTCDKIIALSRKNRLPNHKEFYFKRRFCAFGSTGFTGSFQHDCTGLILTHIPVREPKDDILLAEGADPAYTGPENDDELIALMLSGRGSIDVQFGQKASLSDLWYGNAEKLGQFFPSPKGDLFDRSLADMALFSHLAFWTGRDLARMDRLFRRSGLMREKYAKRPEYQEWTVTSAAKGCRNVYNIPRKNAPVVDHVVIPEASSDVPLTFVPQEDVTGEVSELLAGLPITTSGIMMPSEQLDYFKGMIYIMEHHAVWIVKTDTLMPPERFSAFYGGATFVLDQTGRKVTKSAFEAFTQNNLLRFPKVEKGVFMPNRPSMERFGENSINTYVPHFPKTQEGDVSLFIAHLDKLFATTRDRDIVLYWLASAAQNPDKKIRWAPVIQGVEGNGKSFIGRILSYIIGSKHTHKPNAEDISNKFNDYIEGKLLIIVEEAHMQGRREMKDALKTLITEPDVEIQPKGGKKRMTENFTRWIFFTNHKDAFQIDLRDRRYAMFFTRQQSREDLQRDGMDHVYFNRLWSWFEQGGGREAIAHYLLNLQIPEEMDPTKALSNAPMTSSTQDAITETLGTVEQLVIEARDTFRKGFKGGFVSSWALKELLRVDAPRLNITSNRMASILQQMGYERLGRASRDIYEELNNRPILFALKGTVRDEDYTNSFCSAQGYQTQGAPKHNVVPFDKRVQV